MTLSAVLALLVFALSYALLPTGGADYARDIAPAARQWWDKPWMRGLPQAPWLALIVWPFTALADRVVTALSNGLSVLVLGALIRRWHGPAWLLLPILVSPPFYWLCTNGQTDVLLLGSLFLCGGWEAVALVIKPQVAAVALVARIRGWKTFMPLAAVLAASFAVWGMWPIEIARGYGGLLTGSSWNSSLWPWSIPVGLALTYLAYRQRDERLGVIASPLVAPYVNMPSYLGLVTVAACRFPRAFFTVWLALVVYSAVFVWFATKG